jgi:N-acetylglucosaminyldiphosphoundecaprenol N-acetyl-beta-D-mannosaminyltransferase
MSISLSSFKLYDLPLNQLSINDKLLINTINAHSYNVARKDEEFVEALLSSNVLLPDGISIVHAVHWLTGQRLQKIAGDDLFRWEMERMNKTGGKVFFLGSSENILFKIRNKVSKEYPHIHLKTYSPPFKPVFSPEDNQAMIESVNDFNPDVLFIGMTAPKQEKWAFSHFNELQARHVCCIGAVFDFYAGTVKRAPKWVIKLGLEWLFRFIKEPRRMWRRYLIGNTMFSYAVLKESLFR